MAEKITPATTAQFSGLTASVLPRSLSCARVSRFCTIGCTSSGHPSRSQHWEASLSIWPGTFGSASGRNTASSSKKRMATGSWKMNALTSDHAASFCHWTPKTDFMSGGAKIEEDTQLVTSQFTATCSKRRRRTAAWQRSTINTRPRISRNAPVNLQNSSPARMLDSKPRLVLESEQSVRRVSIESGLAGWPAGGRGQTRTCTHTAATR